MNWMRSLGLRWKILAGFGAVLAMTAVIGMVALRELDAAAERTELLYVVDAGGIEFTMGASDRLNGAAMAEVLAATTTDASMRKSTKPSRIPSAPRRTAKPSAGSPSGRIIACPLPS